MSLRDGKIKRTTLCFVIDDVQQQLLMIYKKRGQGAGKWNVPGGKIQEGESEEQAAIRETIEETGIIPSYLERIGTLEFYFPEGNSWDNICAVFIARHHSGKLLRETEECRNTWVSLQKIPYEKMWDSDRLWAPLVFEGKPFYRVYFFDALDRVTKEENRDSTL